MHTEKGLRFVLFVCLFCFFFFLFSGSFFLFFFSLMNVNIDARNLAKRVPVVLTRECTFSQSSFSLFVVFVFFFLSLFFFFFFFFYLFLDELFLNPLVSFWF